MNDAQIKKTIKQLQQGMKRPSAPSVSTSACTDPRCKCGGKR